MLLPSVDARPSRDQSCRFVFEADFKAFFNLPHGIRKSLYIVEI
jgi:hypothetical protein